MSLQCSLFKLAVLALLALSSKSVWVNAVDAVAEKVEESTVSPIADMAVVDAEVEMKSSTERPPTMDLAKPEEKLSSQRHTVADFIIHPLIAFKPRNPEEEQPSAAGKQAAATTSSTTPSPWQIFGFNAGQGFGSSVSSLAGSVSEWINDRIQMPGLGLETPVRESTTSSSTSTTTTPRPDVVVRVQHKASTRRPLIAINDRNRPNRPVFESEENDDDDEDYDENDEEEASNEGEDGETSDEGGESGNNSEEDEENGVAEVDEEEEYDDADNDNEEDHSQRPNNRRRPIRNQNTNNNNVNQQNRRGRPQNNRVRNPPNGQRRRVPNGQRYQPSPASRRRPVAAQENSIEHYNDDDEYVDGDAFYYGSRPSTKRSQSSPNFIQRGQQQLINQIRQLTRNQSPAEIGAAIRKAQRGSSPQLRRQQATLFVNRNGQTLYVAPELAQLDQQYQQVYAQPVKNKPTAVFPQPPLTKPLKRKGQPTQYITIPWSQLGISPPNNLVSVTEGLQSQPLILNIPQSAINSMQSPSATRNRKRPQLITADAVPLLAEASLMDIFKPPQIPPSRTSNSRPASSIAAANATPVLMASPSTPIKTATSHLQQRIRPGTIVEKAPDMMEPEKTSSETDSVSTTGLKSDMLRTNNEKDFILVGDDDEPGINRQVQPVYGEARYVRLSGNSAFYDVLPKRRFSVRRNGRVLAAPNDADITNLDDMTKEVEAEQMIPVQIVEAESSFPTNTKATESAIEKNFDTENSNQPLSSSISTTASESNPQLAIAGAIA